MHQRHGIASVGARAQKAQIRFQVNEGNTTRREKSTYIYDKGVQQHIVVCVIIFLCNYH